MACEVDLRASDADLLDGFYQMSVPQMASRIGVRGQFRAGDLDVARIWDEDVANYAQVGENELVFPAVEGYDHGTVVGPLLLE